MKNTVALLLIGIVTFFGVAGVSASFAQSQPPDFVVYSIWGTQESPVIAYPGAEGLPLTLQITYLGPVTLYDVNISYAPSFPLSSIEGQGNLSLYVPELSPGQEVSLAGFFNVNAHSKSIAYNQTLTVSYKVLVQVPQLGEELLSGKQNVSFKVPIIGNYSIKLSGFKTLPLTLYSGMYAGGVTVFLTNDGNVAAKDVNITADFVNPLWPLNPSSNKVFLSYLPPGDVVNITFPFGITYGSNVPSAINSTVILTVKTLASSYNFSLPIEVKPAAYFQISGYNYAKMSPGSSDEYVNVNITNVGGSNAKFVTVTLIYNPIFTPYSPSSENPIIGAYSINETFYNIPSNKTFTVSYVINVASGIKPSTYYLPLLISWRQPPTMQTMYQIIDVPITVSSYNFFDGLQGDILYLVAGIVIIILIVMAVYGLRRK